MTAVDVYEDLRPLMFSIAYRMLGSAAEAEDVVQEAFLRMHQTLRRDEPITSPRAYIATLVTRLERRTAFELSVIEGVLYLTMDGEVVAGMVTEPDAIG